ncbi:hypothetical protein [Pinibacter soli]|uniref:Phage protein D n=1 Tax=Pinibacter soli TaxID=3044211 RepID=A0ABT6RB55_9BACT|nr:hypothetical protein [Pinibacter soli]MDI3319127.1 hypothetical protein [Pinibacter soli]
MYLGQTTCEIAIADKYKLRGLHEVQIKKSVHQIVQTARLTLPLSVVMKNSDTVGNVINRTKLIDYIKEGDKISIAFGYDGKHRNEFSGYIKRMNPKQPLELELEDEFYLLRRLRLRKSFLKSDVKVVLTWLMNELHNAFGVSYPLYNNIPDCIIYNMRIDNANGVEVLQDIANKYLLVSYLTDLNGVKTLYCGLKYGLRKQHVKYVLNKNTIRIDDLKFRTVDDTTYKVEVFNQLPNGQLKKFVFGDTKGEVLKLRVSGERSEAELKQRAEAEMTTYNTTGYKGKLEALLFPYIEPGCIADISDPQFKNRAGSHYVGTVTTIFGVSGGRRIPELDITVSA